MENEDLNESKMIQFESNLIQIFGPIELIFWRNAWQHRLERRPIRLLSRGHAFGKRAKQATSALPVLFTRVRNETAETPCETGA